MEALNKSGAAMATVAATVAMPLKCPYPYTNKPKAPSTTASSYSELDLE